MKEKLKIICAISLAALLGSLCACGSVADDVVDNLNRQSEFTTGKTVEENLQDILGLADEHVLGVKGGTNSAYPGVTYGEAFENFFSHPSWRYFVGTQEGPDEDGDGEPDYAVEDIDVVEFTGGCLYADVEVTALIQFVLDNEAGTFQPVYLSFNKVPQNMLMLSGLINTVFTQAIEDLSEVPAESSPVDDAINSSAVTAPEFDNTAAQMAYAEIVRELAADGGDLRFALVNLTGSEIPELVADYTGYGIDVFMWADGAVIPIIEGWAYGAGGNAGYEYLPGQGIIRNFNSDMAGAIVYESYMRVNSAHEIEDVPMEDLSIWYFWDINGNGFPDEGEDCTDNPIYYYGDTEVSAEVYASHRIAGDYQWLSGDETADSILLQLIGETGP